MNYIRHEIKALQRSVGNEELIIEPFIEEMVALVEAFHQSGQSGRSAPFTARAITKSLERLMLFKPLCDLMDTEEEWEDISSYSNDPVKQNKRDSRVFKYLDGTVKYLDVLIWDDGICCFTGKVGKLHSCQKIELPCLPKPRYVKVTRIPTEDPDDYQYKITDPQEEAELLALYKHE